MKAGFVAACIVTLLFPVYPILAAGNDPPQVTLAAKGLSPSGPFFLLQADITLREQLRAMRAAKYQFDQYAEKRARLEAQRHALLAKQSNIDARFHDANLRMAHTSKKSRSYNDIVADVNMLLADRAEAERAMKQLDAELAESKNPQNRYFSAVVNLSDSMESADSQYRTLAADPQVKAALDQINSSGGAEKVKLGPTDLFRQELPVIRRERQRINTGTIKLDVQGGTGQVEVTLNAKNTYTMLLDSGASYVAIPWKVAEEIGATPKSDDPSIELQIATGKVVKAKRVILETVALGPFIAHNVECVVAPKSSPESPMLLGGSFLRNFVYSVDLAAGELHLSQPAAEPPIAAAGRPSVRVSNDASIVVTCSDPIRVARLGAGVTRLYGQRVIPVGAIAPKLENLQFTVIPRMKEISYQIVVRKPGLIYVFGQNRTSMSDAFGDDASNWERVDDLITGDAIRACYCRRVKEGQKLSLHGYELNVAAESVRVE